MGHFPIILISFHIPTDADTEVHELAMGWETTSANRAAIQQSIPFEEKNLSPTARLILDTLRDRGDLRLSQLSDATGLEHSLLLEELLDLEMEDKIRSTPG